VQLNSTLKEKLAKLPEKPGCYIMRDRRGIIIYVGKAVNLRRRVQSYFRDSTLRTAPPKVRSMVHSVEDFEIMTVRNEAEALLTESNLIKQYRPRFNILMRDDKRYLSLRADSGEPLPRITACRIVRDDHAEYFGPFPSAQVVRAVLDFTEKKYGLRRCNPIFPDADTYRHCINDVVRFCTAPCVGRISEEQYHAQFDEACAFLRGERLSVIDEVRSKMNDAAAAHDFEKAAELRDVWMALCEMVKQRSRIVRRPDLQAQVAMAGTEELGRILGMPVPPLRIEGFDISNLFGTHQVASMVVAINGLPDRRCYRRFRIKTVDGADDPRSMAEVVRRRYSRVLEEGKPLPDLILIDGGITQLRSARRELEKLGLSGVMSLGLAEKREEIVLDDGRENLLLPRDGEALKVLIRLRDEAHRFAISFHRHLRGKILHASALDAVPGIGPAKKAMLLRKFGSVARLATASVDEIATMPGIGRELAEAILRIL
jgi:excinuclease ABC subunit C